MSPPSQRCREAPPCRELLELSSAAAASRPEGRSRLTRRVTTVSYEAMHPTMHPPTLPFWLDCELPWWGVFQSKSVLPTPGSRDLAAEVSFTRPHAVGALQSWRDFLHLSHHLLSRYRIRQPTPPRSKIDRRLRRPLSSLSVASSPTTSCAPSLQLWTATPTTPSAPASRYRRLGKPLLHCRPISGRSTHRSSPSPSTFLLDSFSRWPGCSLSLSEPCSERGRSFCSTTTYSTSRRAFPPRVSPLH
jgi:hypothetical protein